MIAISSNSKPRWLLIFVVLWFVTVSAGALALCRYSMISGRPALAAERRPEIRGESLSGRVTLVMVLHPNCPCSRASLSELSTLLAGCGNAPSVEIIFAQPAGLVENIQSTDLWQLSSHVPAAVLVQDVDCVIARKLGATTSGSVFLYDARGILRFNGGITDSRGHAGNNAGRSAIEAILRGDKPLMKTTPVFGCALW